MTRIPSVNLFNMTYLQVKQMAKALSGLTVEEIAERAGYKHSHVARHFQDPDYNISAPHLPKLCLSMGDKLQIEWLNVQVGARMLCFDGKSPQDMSITSQMGKVNDAVTDAVNAALAAVEDGSLDPVELVDIYDKLARARVKIEAAMMAVQGKAAGVGLGGRA